MGRGKATLQIILNRKDRVEMEPIEEMIAFMAEHRNRMNVSEHRIKDLEEQNKQILAITVSVEKLAKSMEAMVTEQKTQGVRLQKLENEPAEKWNSARKTFFTAVTSAAGTAIAGIIIWLFVYAAQNM
ncbi:MAG: hypothetical protein PHQ72_08475 [Hespellia sp.]|nr:hypothetical protein [Hespellia sp.]